MSTTPRRWIVRRSGFPFSLPGKVLGVLEARHMAHAQELAAEQFPSIAVSIEPEHRVKPELERAVERAVKSADRRARAGGGRPRFARQAMKSTPDGDDA